MKARIPKHREFVITFPEGSEEARNNEAWDKLNTILNDYKKEHPGGVYEATFIEDCQAAVDALKDEYGFEYTVELR